LVWSYIYDYISSERGKVKTKKTKMGISMGCLRALSVSGIGLFHSAENVGEVYFT
jgi:hypothetical protein